LEREPFFSAYSLAEAVYMSPATVMSRLYNSLGMEFCHLCWVPRQLKDDLLQNMVSFFACWKLYNEPFFTTLSQTMKTGLSSNTSMPHNGRSLAMKCLKA
jgi:hypothetical protein